MNPLLSRHHALRWFFVSSVAIVALLGQLQAQQPYVTLSFPPDLSLCRATVPIFGTAIVLGGKDDLFKEWRLEYGEGRRPEKWTRIAGGTRPVKRDPWARHEVVWSPNTGASGNLANWNTGLVGYGYGEWRNNFNGIYTVRLIAELRDGRTAERRLTLFVGEAILQMSGGTAHCVDGLCRFSVPPFFREKDEGTVIAIVRQEPPGQKRAYATSESGPEAESLYRAVPSTLALLSPIYRLYPVGLEMQPPGQLEIDLPPEGSISTPQATDVIAVYDASQGAWLPMRTQWIGRTAVTSVSRLGSPIALFAVVRHRAPPTAPRVSWMPDGGLCGLWVGTAEAGCTLKLRNVDLPTSIVVPEAGRFELPFVLDPQVTSYDFQAVRATGEASEVAHVRASAKVEIPGPKAQLRILGKPELTEGETLSIEADLTETPEKLGGLSLAAIVRRADLKTVAIVELKPLASGSRIYSGVLRIGTHAGEILPNSLPHGENLTIELAAGQRARFTYRDAQPPIVRALTSPTHPAQAWSTPLDASTKTIEALNSFSGVTISEQRGAWKLTGSATNTSRLIRWPLTSYSLAAFPVLSFEYRCSDPAPWQLLLCREAHTYCIPLGSMKPHFPVLLNSPPLQGDGRWHTFETSLQQFRTNVLDQIDSIMMGSWVDATAYLTVEAGFKSAEGNALELRNLWVGKPSTETSAILQWIAEDASGVRRSEWWLDTNPESTSPDQSALKGEVVNMAYQASQKASVRVALPKAGRWFFHVRAEDAAGNVGKPALFLLRVMPTWSGSSPLSQAATPEPSVTLPTWNQPDGVLKLSLPGVGMGLDPTRTQIAVNGVVHAAPRASWDSVSETLTLQKESFQEHGPLGWDGEIMEMDLLLFDLNGRPLPQRMHAKVAIQSPYYVKETGDGLAAGRRTPTPQKIWYASWAGPTPPWANLFPGAVCNTLQICEPIPASELRKRRPFIWQRLIKMCPPDSPSITWRESWDSPHADQLEAAEAIVAETTPLPGKGLHWWTWKLEGTKPFSPSTVRIVTASPDGALALQELEFRELAGVMPRLKPGGRMRIDGWLHPAYAPFVRFQIGSPFRVSWGWEADAQWFDVRGKELLLSSDEGWKRFAILIEMPRRANPARQEGVRVDGNSYW